MKYLFVLVSFHLKVTLDFHRSHIHQIILSGFRENFIQNYQSNYSHA